MSGPVVEVDPNDLYSHSVRSQNRATDYHSNPNGVGDEGWPSQRAYEDAQQSAAGAGRAFGDRQDERGAAVKGAADGYVGQDEDSGKMLQGIGAVVGPIIQGIASAVQGAMQGAAQGLSGGATALSGMLTSGGTLLSQGLPKGPQQDVLTTPGGGKGGSALGSPAGAPGSPIPLSPYQTGSRGPDKGDRPEGGSPGLKVEPAVGIMPSGMGLGGMPRPQQQESEQVKPVAVAKVKPDDDPDTAPIPVFVQANIKEA